MDTTMKYTHSEYDYTTIQATWQPQYAMMAELPDDTLRTTGGFDAAVEVATQDTANELHEWITERLQAAQPFYYTFTDGDYTQSVTHNWSGDHLTVKAYLGGFHDAPSVEILYDGISDEAGSRMEDTTLMDQMMEEFERVISESHETGTNYKGDTVNWVTTLEEKISEISTENFYEAVFDNSVRFDDHIWGSVRTGVVTEERMVEMKEDYNAVISQLADDDSLYIPDAESINQDGEILVSTLQWWDGTTADIGSRDRWSELPNNCATDRLKVIEYLQASQGVICVPRADCHRSVAKRDITYIWEASADADDIRAANGYLFDLTFITDAAYYSEAA